MTSSWFFLSTLNYDARSTTHQIYNTYLILFSNKLNYIGWIPWENPIRGSFNAAYQIFIYFWCTCCYGKYQVDVVLLCHLIDLQEEQKPLQASHRLSHIQRQNLIVVFSLVYILIIIALCPAPYANIVWTDWSIRIKRIIPI